MFLPPHYTQDNCTTLHHIKQETKSVEEYTHGIEKPPNDFGRVTIKAR